MGDWYRTCDGEMVRLDLIAALLIRSSAMDSHYVSASLLSGDTVVLRRFRDKAEAAMFITAFTEDNFAPSGQPGEEG